jgi:hypothetical protein
MIKTISRAFYAIPVTPLRPTCSSGGKYLSIGTFKTAQPGYLFLIHLAEDGLGTKPNESVATKRMYVARAKKSKASPNGFVIDRLTPVDEFAKTMMEADV